jgi:nucleoside-diphosphate-sugar epimerase
MSTDNTSKVVVFGSTGCIGRHLINIMSKKQPNWEIFAVTRDAASCKKFSHLKNVKVVQGDPANKEEVLKLSQDKDVVFSTIGFAKYERKYWAKYWPVVVENLLAGSSQQAHQKLVFCDNLYAHGGNTNISTKTKTVAPSTKSKPAVRALIRPFFQERMDANPNSIVVVGGADFFGEFVTQTSFLGDTFTKAIIEGKPAPIAVGSASVVHDFCYAPDFSNALYLASINEEANGKFWICPHTIHGKSLQDIATDIARLSGSENSKVTVYPGWTVKLLSPFVGFLWEMVEMLPFWSKDYTIDDSEFCKTFAVSATPYEEALQAYIDFYKKNMVASPEN